MVVITERILKRSQCFAQLGNMLLNSPLVKLNPPPPCEINQDNFQDMLGHLDLPGWEECSKKCWPCLERPRAPAKEDAERQGNQKKSCHSKLPDTLCRSLAMCVLPVMDVLQIHDWIHDWNCKFMTGGLILINKDRGVLKIMCEPVHPRLKLIRIFFKTRADTCFFLDGRNVQRNVGLASPGRAPQPRKTQNAEGIKKIYQTKLPNTL